MCTIILRESASPNQKSCEGGCAGAWSSRVTRVRNHDRQYRATATVYPYPVRAVRGW